MKYEKPKVITYGTARELDFDPDGVFVGCTTAGGNYWCSISPGCFEKIEFDLPGVQC